jgi:type IV pilus assembly protein PilP
MSRFGKLVLLAVLAALGSACGGEAPAPAPATTPAAAPKADAKKEDVPVDAPPPAEYAYSAVGKRDPFRSFFEDYATASEANAGVAERCGPLCRWDLEQLKLVAVVSGTTTPLAMVEDPEGRGYFVRRGSYIGKRSGKVSDIRRDVVVVTELIRQENRVIPANTELYLRPPGLEKDKEEIVDLSSPEARR